MRLIFAILLCAPAIHAACSAGGGFAYAVPVTFAATPANDWPVFLDTQYGTDGAVVTGYWSDVAAKVRATDGYDIQFFSNDAAGGAALKQDQWPPFDDGDWQGVVSVPLAGTMEICGRYGKADESADTSDRSATGVFGGFSCVVANGEVSDRSGASCAPALTSTLVTEPGLIGDAIAFTANRLTMNGNGSTDTAFSFTMVIRSPIHGGATPGQRLFRWVGSNTPEAYLGWGVSSYWSSMIFAGLDIEFADPATDIAAEEWYVIGCTVVDTTNVECWRDGVSIDAVTTGITAMGTRSADMIFGSNDAGSAGYFTGEGNAFFFHYQASGTPKLATAAEQAYLTAMFKDQDAFATWGTEVGGGAARALPVGGGVAYFIRPVASSWEPAPASATAACDQVNAALGWDPGQSTPTGNQFVICSPEGERLKTGFAPE